MKIKIHIKENKRRGLSALITEWDISRNTQISPCRTEASALCQLVFYLLRNNALGSESLQSRFVGVCQRYQRKAAFLCIFQCLSVSSLHLVHVTYLYETRRYLLILKRKVKSQESGLIDLDICNANELITPREDVCWLMSCTQLLCADTNQCTTEFVQTPWLLHHTGGAWLGDCAILKFCSLLSAYPCLEISLCQARFL